MLVNSTKVNTDGEVYHDSYQQQLEEEEEDTAATLEKEDDDDEKPILVQEVVQVPDESQAGDESTVFPQVSMDLLTIGTLLGRGGFGSVYGVASSQPIAKNAPQRIMHEYALKRLSDDVFEDEDDEDDDYQIEAAAKDLLIEATILSKLPNHTNVIRCHAVSAGFWENPARGFLILDKLSDTLADRIQRWMRLPEARAKQRARVRSIAPGIASALQFLHSHNVIYRDLKPQNIGFDAEGNAQIFDFGLARTHHADDKRKLTARTGSARYMAPENIRGQHYSFPADVYSFSILLWEVCTLQKAYASAASMGRLLRQVAHGSARPSRDRIESSAIKFLLEQCWQHEAALRPTFSQILGQLELQK
jgi:serine/threonine protein kinase